MSALAIIVNIILILVSIVLIIAVLMQQGQRQGLGAIGGGAETFFGKNKAKSYEGKLALITKIAAAVFIVLAIVATIITTQNEKKNAADLSDIITGEIDSAADLYNDLEGIETDTTDTEATEDTEVTEDAVETEAPAETEAADAEVTEAPEETDAE